MDEHPPATNSEEASVAQDTGSAKIVPLSKIRVILGLLLAPVLLALLSSLLSFSVYYVAVSNTAQAIGNAVTSGLVVLVFMLGFSFVFAAPASWVLRRMKIDNAATFVVAGMVLGALSVLIANALVAADSSAIEAARKGYADELFVTAVGGMHMMLYRRIGGFGRKA